MPEEEKEEKKEEPKCTTTIATHTQKEEENRLKGLLYTSTYAMHACVVPYMTGTIAIPGLVWKYDFFTPYYSWVPYYCYSTTKAAKYSYSLL